MKTEESRKLVLDYLAAQGRGDRARMLELLDANAEWAPPASIGLGTSRGAENVLGAFAEAGAKYFDLGTMKAEVRKIVADGDTVVIRMHNEVRAVNGRDYSNEYVWIYTCANGRIVRIEEHTDSLRFKQIVLDG